MLYYNTTLARETLRSPVASLEAVVLSGFEPLCASHSPWRQQVNAEICQRNFDCNFSYRLASTGCHPAVKRFAVSSLAKETSLSPAPHRPKGEVSLPCGNPSNNPARIGCAFLLRGFTPRACKASPRIPKGTRVRSLLALATPILAG